jgi:hypothetical protein
VEINGYYANLAIAISLGGEGVTYLIIVCILVISIVEKLKATSPLERLIENSIYAFMH